jgi:hypothetical protein
MYGDWVCNAVHDRDSEDQTVTIIGVMASIGPDRRESDNAEVEELVSGFSRFPIT